ncbi:hypothetical protein ABW20_dc0108712 [Dactylellina cionopaga]|nr:hypothetical protein ABW20_dc0108712 [Dactylellina cionopaga]
MDGRRGSTGPANASSRGSNSGFQSPSSGPGNLASVDWVIGTRVKVTTILDDTVEGLIFSYDTIANCVSLITGPNAVIPPPKSASVNVRILKIPFLKDVVVTTPSKPPQNASTAKGPFSAAEPQIRPLSIQAMRNREQATLKTEYEKMLGHGVGVTTEGQDIFAALSKTMPCRWQEKDIIVLDTIIIQEPYTPDKCSSPNANGQNALARVKKVLEGERKKLERSNASTPNPPGDRKGG